MIIFIFSWAVLILLSFPKSLDFYGRLVAFFSIIPLVAVGLFRDGIGTDWESYVNIYFAISTGVYEYEPGWILVNMVGNLLGGFGWVVSLCYLLIFTCYVLSPPKRKLVIYIFSMLCLFRLGVYFTRIEIACIVFASLLLCIQGKSYKKAGFLLFLSFSFHWSACLVFLIYLSVIIRKIKIYYSVFPLIFCILLFFVLREKIEDSFIHHLQVVGSAYESGSLRIVIKGLVVWLLMYASVRRKKELSDIYLFGCLVVVFSCAGVLFFSPGFERLFSYSYSAVIVLLVCSWEKQSDLSRISCLVILSSSFYAWMMSPYMSMYFPISTIFD